MYLRKSNHPTLNILWIFMNNFAFFLSSVWSRCCQGRVQQFLFWLMIFLYFLQAVKSLEFYCFHSELKSLQFFELSVSLWRLDSINRRSRKKDLTHLLLGNFFASSCSSRLASFELKSSFHVKLLGLISEI